MGKYLIERAANEHCGLENLQRSPVPVGYLWGLRNAGQPARVANHVWQTYLNERDVESSLWYLLAAEHYPQLDKPAEVAEAAKLCLQGEVPSRAEENTYMRSHARGTSVDSPILIGHTVTRQMEFPGAVEYSPSGFRF